MANSNTLTTAIPTILAQGLMMLRQATTMPALINTDYSREAAEQGDTIDVNTGSAISAQDVTQSNTPPDDAGVTPTKVSIALSNWRETPFFLTDKDISDAMNGIIPMQSSQALGALAEDVNAKIFAEYNTVYGYTGTAATTPFASDLTDASGARKVLNNQKAFLNPRHLVLDPDAEENALGNRAVQDASFRRAGEDTLTTGNIGNVMGFGWNMDQQVPTHTAGTASGATTDNAGYALGVKTITLDSAGTGTILVGDVFTIAGDTQTYVVITGDADVSGGGTVVFEPGLQVAITTSATAITLKATHVVNLAFHPAAFALAVRPAALPGGFTGGNMISSAVDPVSGLALRLEVSRQHYRTRFAYSILYGVQCVRPELACRVAG